MIPIRDDAPRYTTPYINYFLLAINTIVFMLTWLSGPREAQQIVNIYGMVPARTTAFLHGLQGVNSAIAFVPILTSMFLHASWMHLIFNMWALYIFGDNIEDYLGHFRYLLFYLICGFAAAFLHILMNPNSTIPSVGASGAIAGVMGAYFILYPSARVLTLVPFFFIFFIHLPAWVVLGFWFLGQFLSGAATSIAYSSQTQSGGGIAFWAHVGGFVAGVAIIKLFPTRPRRYRYFYR
jgi:membrane associated rhomboid family serine protease